MLKDLRKLNKSEQQEYLDRFFKADEEQKFPQEVVALYLDCSPWTLARMRCDQSSMPFSKIGRRVSYKKRDVLQYERSKTVLNTAQLAAV
ncbi:DNA-binding protein [Acinetobacter sp.]|uniref:DNA-binding protein n=1 Tax=Acinetobacter sp. TaxID=472 RepID=UPI0031DADA70